MHSHFTTQLPFLWLGSHTGQNSHTQRVWVTPSLAPAPHTPHHTRTSPEANGLEKLGKDDLCP